MSTSRHGREGGLDKPRVRRGVGLRHSVAVLRRSIATTHIMEILCFCFVLFLYCFEDLFIGLMRTLKVYEKVPPCL